MTYGNRDYYYFVPYLCGTLLMLATYPRFLLWGGTWLGLRIRGQTRATISTLGLLLVWLILPPACGVIPHILFDAFPDPPGFMLISPLLAIPIHETAEYREFVERSSWLNPTFFILSSIAIHWGLANWFRRDCFRRADQILNRGATVGVQ